MNKQHEYRKMLADLGIDDDRAERALVDMFQEKDEALELAKVKVSAREDALQNQLMEERVKGGGA